MRIKFCSFVFCLTVVGAGAAPALAQSELVIDNFKDGPYHEVLANYPTWLVAYQLGSNVNIIGGVRQTSFTVTPSVPDIGQSTLLQIRRDGYLVLNGDYKSFFGLILGYGYDEYGGARRLNVNLSRYSGDCPDCDRFRIAFDGSDSEFVYLVQVYDSNGHIATFTGPESTARGEEFHLDAPFAEFAQDSSRPVDWEHIDFIVVLFQTGNVLGSHDFAVRKISAMPDSTP